MDPAKALVANVSPASITNGVTPIGSGGTTADDIREDIKALLSAFVTGNQDLASLVLITTPGIGLALSLMRNALGQAEFPGTSIQGAWWNVEHLGLGQEVDRLVAELGLERAHPALVLLELAVEALPAALRELAHLAVAPATSNSSSLSRSRNSSSSDSFST